MENKLVEKENFESETKFKLEKLKPAQLEKEFKIENIQNQHGWVALRVSEDDQPEYNLENSN